MPMTVADLRAQLTQFPDDAIVVLAEDGEGNGFSPLCEAIPAMYLAETTWSGEHYPTEEQRLAEDDPDEYDPAPEGSVPAVFLWPTN